eukprot:GFYU01021608.1.p1 GENE.GFYU01021608.1~~GFYU01021608.1.p1  ORF type:complete len:372 (-),score=135.97 GFYU01021608.1:129-1220(-)
MVLKHQNMSLRQEADDAIATVSQLKQWKAEIQSKLEVEKNVTVREVVQNEQMLSTVMRERDEAIQLAERYKADLEATKAQMRQTLADEATQLLSQLSEAENKKNEVLMTLREFERERQRVVELVRDFEIERDHKLVETISTKTLSSHSRREAQSKELASLRVAFKDCTIPAARDILSLKIKELERDLAHEDPNLQESLGRSPLQSLARSSALESSAANASALVQAYTNSGADSDVYTVVQRLVRELQSYESHIADMMRIMSYTESKVDQRDERVWRLQVECEQARKDQLRAETEAVEAKNKQHQQAKTLKEAQEEAKMLLESKTIADEALREAHRVNQLLQSQVDAKTERIQQLAKYVRDKRL